MLGGLVCDFNVDESARTAFGGAAACKSRLREAGLEIRRVKKHTRRALFALREWGDGAFGLPIESIHHGSTPVGSDEHGSAVADPLHQLTTATLAFVDHRLRSAGGAAEHAPKSPH